MQIKNMESTICNTVSEFRSIEKELVRQIEMVYNIVSTN